MIARTAALFACLFALSALPSAVGQTDKPGDSPALTFELYKDAGGEFRWRLKAGNSKILATAGQGYKAKADAKAGVARIQKDAADKLKFEVYEDKKGEHRWRVKATNGQVIGTSSEGYKAKADADKAVEEIKAGAAKAKVEEKAD